MATADQIDALLPQTQCTRCGYPGCRPYAEAIAAGAADINQCPPGGAATIAALARLLSAAGAAAQPGQRRRGPALVAQIDEAACIGCAKCLPPCPVDAILGAQQADAHRAAGAVHRLRAVRRALPGRLHPHGAARAARRRRRRPAAAENRRRFARAQPRAAHRAAARAALLQERKRGRGAAGLTPVTRRRARPTARATGPVARRKPSAAGSGKIATPAATLRAGPPSPG